jgi:hypothetical protein
MDNIKNEMSPTLSMEVYKKSLEDEFENLKNCKTDEEYIKTYRSINRLSFILYTKLETAGW